MIRNIYCKIGIIVLLIIGIAVSVLAYTQREIKKKVLKENIMLQEENQRLVQVSEAPKFNQPSVKLKDIQSNRFGISNGDPNGDTYSVSITSLLQNSFSDYVASKFGDLYFTNLEVVEKYNKEQKLFDHLCLDQNFVKEKYEIKVGGDKLFVELGSKKYEIKSGETERSIINYQKVFKEQVFLSLMKQHPEANPLQIKDEINKQNLEITESLNFYLRENNCFVLKEVK